MDEKDVLPAIIRKYREDKGFTQEELSRLIHKSEKYIGAVECGRIAPPFVVLKEIVQILEIDGNALFYDNVNSTSSNAANIYLSKMDISLQRLALDILRTMAYSQHGKNSDKSK